MKHGPGGHSVLCQSNFRASVGPSLASCQQLSAKIDAVFSHSTISVDAEPFHDIHMGPMSDVVMRNSLMGANLCQANPIFGLQLWPELGKPCGQISAKVDAVCGHGTISVAAEPFHVIHMGPMSDVVM